MITLCCNAGDFRDYGMITDDEISSIIVRPLPNGYVHYVVNNK